MEYLLSKIVNDNPKIKPSIGLTHFKQQYMELEQEYPVAEMPSEAQIRQKISALKVKVAKNGRIECTIPEKETG